MFVQRRMPRGLIVTTHHTERHNGLTFLHRHARNNRVHRPLAWLDPVRVVRLETETVSSVVQNYATVRRHDTAAEALEDGIDEGNCITVTVNDAKLSCVGMLDTGTDPAVKLIACSSAIRPRAHSARSSESR